VTTLPVGLVIVTELSLPFTMETETGLAGLIGPESAAGEVVTVARPVDPEDASAAAVEV
jgi:hypothetical protein